MSIRKNTPGQELLVFAFDRITNDPVTGDAANITAKLRLDFGTATATSTSNPTEIEDGYYGYPVTQAETNADVIDVLPESSTADVQVIGVPARIFTSPTAVSVALGPVLASRSQLELMFGKDNVSKWADLDNDQNATNISERIDQALAFATEDAYDRMRGGPVAVPITGDFPLSLVDAVTRLAGVWLYENRGVNDASDEKRGEHRLTYHLKRADQYFRDVRSGRRRLDVANQSSAVPTIHPSSWKSASEA